MKFIEDHQPHILEARIALAAGRPVLTVEHTNRLLQRHGQTVAPSLILKEVWGYEPDDDIETIRVHVRHLRTKLEPDPRKPRFIKTVYGAGYCLELPSERQAQAS